MSRVSVIVPVYNSEKFLTQCVDSILGQTHRDIELILVDDGSDDLSAQICDDYEQKDSRVKVLHQPNCGISVSRNNGLEMATGEYIAFVDSDDFIDERMCERLLEVINNCDADMVICDIYQIDEKQMQLDRKCGIQDEVVAPRKLLARLSDKGGWVYTVVWNRLYKRNVFNNIRFPDGKIREDEWVTLSIYTACKRIVLTGDALYYYRANSNSIMGKKSNIAHLDGVEAVYNRFLKFQEYGWMELLPSAFLCGRNMFENLRYIKISQKEDKERIKNAVGMYRYMMKHTGCKISLKNRLVGWFPVLYFKMKNILR